MFNFPHRMGALVPDTEIPQLVRAEGLDVTVPNSQSPERNSTTLHNRGKPATPGQLGPRPVSHWNLLPTHNLRRVHIEIRI